MSPKDIIEGSWRLDLWDDEGRQWKSPEACGRFVLRDGIVIFMAQRPSLRGSYARYAYGQYALTETTWSYGYLHDTIVRETEAGIAISRDLPWNGLRTFNLMKQGSRTELISGDGTYKLVTKGTGISISSQTGSFVLGRAFDPFAVGREGCTLVYTVAHQDPTNLFRLNQKVAPE